MVQLITDECLKILRELPGKLNDFNRKFDGLLFENDHDGLIELCSKICTDDSVAKAAEKCVRLFESVAEFCHNVILQWINDAKEQIQLLLSEYHENKLLVLQHVKLYIELRSEIIKDLISNPTKWRKLSLYVKSELKDRLAAVESECRVKTQKISSRHVHQKLIQ